MPEAKQTTTHFPLSVFWPTLPKLQNIERTGALQRQILFIYSSSHSGSASRAAHHLLQDPYPRGDEFAYLPPALPTPHQSSRLF